MGKIMQKDDAALVLEGGALRSIYEAGVLDVFLEKEIEFPYVIGVSAGALNAGNYISKQIGRSAKVNIDYVDDPRYIGIRHLLKEHSIFNFEFLFGEPTKEWMPYDEEQFLKTQQRYIVGATNCKTGKENYFEKHTYQKLTEVLRASSTLPILSDISYIDGIPYIDGGVANAIPIDKAIVDGYKKIVVILTRQEGFKSRPSILINSIYRVYYRKYPHLVKKLCTMAKRYNQRVALINKLEKQGRIFVIRPEKPVRIGKIEKNKIKLNMLYEEGRREALNNIDKMLEYLNK